jgi:hypothetical protein
MADHNEPKHVMDIKVELIEGKLISTTVFADPDFKIKACCSCTCSCIEIDSTTTGKKR